MSLEGRYTQSVMQIDENLPLLITVIWTDWSR